MDQETQDHLQRSGDAITEELPTGEVVSTVASDAMRVGQLPLKVAKCLVI